MTAARTLACVFALAAALPVLAGDPPPALNDPVIATWVPTGAQDSAVPLPLTFVVPGVAATSATQALSGVGAWSNTNVWPVEMGAFTPARYIEIAIDPADDRVVRVSRIRYASVSYGASNGVLMLATNADGYAAPQGSATSNGPGLRQVQLAIFPASIEAGPGPRTLRLYPYQTTSVLDWLDLEGASGGLAIDGRIALVRSVTAAQDRYSFTTDTLGGSALPAAITHVQFALAPPVVALVPFAATAPRTACLPGIALLDIAGAVDPATITGLGAPCNAIDPTTTTATTLWKLSSGAIYGLQVMQVSPSLVFRVRRLDDSVFASGFE